MKSILGVREQPLQLTAGQEDFILVTGVAGYIVNTQRLGVVVWG